MLPPDAPPPEAPVPAGEAPPLPPLLRDFALEVEPPSVAPPFMFGLVAGLLAFQSFAAAGLGRLPAMVLGLVVGGLIAAAFAWSGRRRVPDRVHVSGDALSMMRGDAEIARVNFDRLDEVNELETPVGPLLVVGDGRTTLGVPAAQLRAVSEYTELTATVVEAMRRLDPTGTRSARAVEAGRARQQLAAVPVRASIWLALLLLATGLAAFVGLEGRLYEPFPVEWIGGLGAPLVVRGETYRLLSYAFLHVDFAHLVLSCLMVLWIGTWLERVAGWERTLLAFTVGVAGLAATVVALDFPSVVVGAGGGTAGMLGAVFGLLATGRLASFFRPRRDFWGVVGGAAVLLILFQPSSALALLVAPAEFPWQLVVAHGAALVAGFVAALSLSGGHTFPLPPEERKGAWAFGWLAVAALAIGLLGGALHHRRDHPDDAPLLAQALLDAKIGPHVRAHEQNEAAYRLLFDPAMADRWLDLSTHLAEQAVADSGERVPEMLDTLAVARYRAGNREEAAQLVRQAMELARTDAPAHPARKQLLEQLERRLADIEAGAVLER